MNARANPHRFSSLAGIICIATGAISMQAALGEEANVSADKDRTVAVYYGDLNLQRPASIASLYRRIERAAERVCMRPNFGLVQQKHAVRNCMTTTIDRAVVSIDLPALDKYAAQVKAGLIETSG